MSGYVLEEEDEYVDPGPSELDASLRLGAVALYRSQLNVNKETKFYYRTDVIRNAISTFEEVDQLFAEDKYPTLLQLVSSCEQEGYEFYTPYDEDDAEDKEGKLMINKEGKVQKNFFNRGDWIEFLSGDMKWKIAQITAVVTQAPDEWDYDEHDGKEPPAEDLVIFYNIGAGYDGLIPETLVRAPKDGLVALFGQRPWLWQQHCLLQLEKRLRFQKSHEDDFDEVDMQKFAKKRFEAWLIAPGNEDFLQHYEDQTILAQKMLQAHLLTPFELMDRITEKDEEWDFTDPNITIYTYYGVLGSGLSMVIITITIQLLAFLVLFFNQFLQIDNDPNYRWEVTAVDISDARSDFVPDSPAVNLFGDNFFAIPSTSFEQFCPQNGRSYGKMLLFAILLLYCVEVLPNTLYKWFRVSGGDASTGSKINSLRSRIWDANADSLAQQLGFKLDRFMNTGFISLLYMAMLLILLSTDNLVDIILNALAINFIHEIDEKLADSDWWDRDRRWITAGTLELVLRAELDLNVLTDAAAICGAYNIDKSEYKKALGGMYSLKNRSLADKDDDDEEFMTKKEKVWKRSADYAIKNNRKRAVAQFAKLPTYFGLAERFFAKSGLSFAAMFERHKSYRVWSRWEKVLFLPKVPFIIDKEKMKKQRKVRIDDYQYFEVCGYKLERTDTNLFIIHILSVLSFVAAFDSIRQIFRRKRATPWVIIWRVFEALLQFFSYLCILVFPIYLVVALFLYPICY